VYGVPESNLHSTGTFYSTNYLPPSMTLKEEYRFEVV